ncbi:MAG: 16S rRNA (adenine(1518)-N(6)/adenine(1519)-N(6))-dimethyltransferase RsmA [Ignavibacteriaceae bacterium]|nr:16S rRNA (adenine(1518)-N(6)/adenine(1519)-N(6))-dimethyltransferase RsmA [Ignavibacteriaceae bacterium]
MQFIKPLKKFGQNYLTDPNILRKIVEEIDPNGEDNIIEIGPGLGALTEFLLQKVPTITAIEIDNRVGEILRKRFQGIELITEDFLKTDLNAIYHKSGKKLRITGNIPYNLTSPILFRMIENNQIVKDAVLMMQLEVAQRIISKKGTKEYGILSVLLNYFCEIKFCFKVSPNVFNPRPKVWSAVLHFYLKENDLTDTDKKVFIQTVKAAFGNRRKTLKNSLSNSIFKEINFEDSGIDISLRAEQLDIDNFVLLSKYIQSKLKETKDNSHI